MSKTDWEHAERAYLIKDLSGDFGRLPMLTRGLARELLVISDRWGIIPLGAESAVDVICRRGGAYTDERRMIRRMLPKLLRDGYVVEHDGALVIRNYVLCKYGRHPDKLQNAEAERARVLAECAARAAEERAIPKVSHKKKTDVGDPKPSDVPPPPSAPKTPGAQTEASTEPPIDPPSTPVEPPADPPRTPGLHEISANPLNDTSHGGIPVRAFPVHTNTPQTPLPGVASPGEAELPPKAKTPRKARSRPTSAPEPMPWTIAEMLAELARTAPSRAIVSPFDPALAKPLTLVIRGLAAGGCTFADITLVGEWFAAGGLGFLTEGIGLNWFAKAGNLADAIGKSRKWRDAGRPSLGSSPAAQPRLAVVPQHPSHVDGIAKLHFPKRRFSEDPAEREREVNEIRARHGLPPRTVAAR